MNARARWAVTSLLVVLMLALLVPALASAAPSTPSATS
jgi:hypothetical protein